MADLDVAIERLRSDGAMPDAEVRTLLRRFEEPRHVEMLVAGLPHADEVGSRLLQVLFEPWPASLESSKLVGLAADHVRQLAAHVESNNPAGMAAARTMEMIRALSIVVDDGALDPPNVWDPSDADSSLTGRSALRESLDRGMVEALSNEAGPWRRLLPAFTGLVDGVVDVGRWALFPALPIGFEPDAAFRLWKAATTVGVEINRIVVVPDSVGPPGFPAVARKEVLVLDERPFGGGHRQGAGVR